MSPEKRDALQSAIDSMGELIALERQKIDTMQKLRKAYAIALLLDMKPSEMGPVSPFVEEGRSPFRRWIGAKLAVNVGGRTRRFPLERVDLLLWPDDLRKAYERDKR